MRSERKWRLNYVDANSECSEDNELVQLRSDLDKYVGLLEGAQQSLLAQRALNEELRVKVDELTAFNNQIIVKVKELSKGATDQQLQHLLQELEARVHHEQNKYSHLERLHNEQAKELSLCTEMLSNERQENDMLRQDLRELEGTKMSIMQYEELKAKVSELEMLNGQLNSELKAECLRIQQSSDGALQDQRRKYLENYEQFLQQKKILKKEIEALTASNGSLCEEIRELKNAHLSDIGNRLTVPSAVGEPKWKERARESQFIAGKELATSKVKIERLELALEHSDRRIAELESELYTAKKPFTASEVKPMFCPKPSRIDGVRSPAPKLRRLPEGLGSPSINNPSFSSTEKTESKPLPPVLRNDGQVGYFSLAIPDCGQFAKRQNISPNLSNIKLLDSVQLKHSETEANLGSLPRYQPLRLNISASSNMTAASYTDRQAPRKPALLDARSDTKWVNLMR